MFRPARPLALASSLTLGASSFTLGACSRAPERSHERHTNPSEATNAPFEPTSRATVRANGQLGPGRGKLIVHFEAPAGAELSEGAPVRLEARGEHLAFPTSVRTSYEKQKTLPLEIPVDVTDGALGPAELDLTYYFCTRGNDASCRPERARLTVPLDLSGHGEGGEAVVHYRPTT